MNATACSSALADLGPWRDIDNTVTHLADPTRWHDGAFNGNLADGCLAWQHCQATDMFPLSCDHLELKMSRVHWSTKLLLVVLALLMALKLTEEIDEAAVEEALIEQLLRENGLSAPVPSISSPYQRFCVELVRGALRFLLLLFGCLGLFLIPSVL